MRLQYSLTHQSLELFCHQISYGIGNRASFAESWLSSSMLALKSLSVPWPSPNTVLCLDKPSLQLRVAAGMTNIMPIQSDSIQSVPTKQAWSTTFHNLHPTPIWNLLCSWNISASHGKHPARNSRSDSIYRQHIDQRT